MSDRSEVALEELDRFLVERNAARLHYLADIRSPEKRRVVTFPFNTTPTVSDFERLYERRLEWYKHIAGLKIPGSKADGTTVEVPITIGKPEKEEDHTYHIVSITRVAGYHRRRRRERAEIVIRQSDNYIVAFRVFKSEAERAHTPWCVFADVELPDYFGKQVKMKYTTTHGNLEKVRYSAHVLEDIFRFLSKVQSNPQQATTLEGKNYFVTLFVLLGEAQRFWLLQRFFIDNAVSDKPQKPGQPLCKLFNSWSQLCKLVFQYYIAFLEMPLFDAYKAAHEGDQGYKNPFANKDNANASLALFLQKHGDALSFKPDARGFYLVGRDLLLLNSDSMVVLDILMRQRGYGGKLLFKKRHEEESAQLAFEQKTARTEKEAEEEGKETEEGRAKEAEEIFEGEKAKEALELTNEEMECKRQQKKAKKKLDKQLQRFSGGNMDFPEEEDEEGQPAKATSVETKERSEEGFKEPNKKKLQSRKAATSSQVAESKSWEQGKNTMSVEGVQKKEEQVSSSCEEEAKERFEEGFMNMNKKKLQSRKAATSSQVAESKSWEQGKKIMSVEGVKKMEQQGSRSCEEENKGVSVEALKKSKEGAHHSEPSKVCEEENHAKSIERAQRKKQQLSNFSEDEQKHQKRNKQKQQPQRLSERDVTTSSDKAEQNSSSEEKKGKKNNKKKKKKKKN